jgi:hypothetical protein
LLSLNHLTVPAILSPAITSTSVEKTHQKKPSADRLTG